MVLIIARVIFSLAVLKASKKSYAMLSRRSITRMKLFSYNFEIEIGQTQQVGGCQYDSFLSLCSNCSSDILEAIPVYTL